MIQTTHARPVPQHPVLRGGDEYEDVLAQIRDELAAANAQAREAPDDQQRAARVQQLRAELATATAAAGGQDGGGGTQQTGTAVLDAAPPQPGSEAELEQLRAFYRQATQRNLAEAVADRVVREAQQQLQRDEDDLTQLVETIVAKRLGVQEISGAVRRTLSTSRSGSRFVTPDATADVVDQLAAGGEVSVPERYAHAQGTQGELRGLDHMRKNHPLGHMVRSLYRLKMNRATEVDRRFFDECMRKAMAEGTPSAGGVLVPLEYMPDVLGLLRSLAVVRRAGPAFRNFARQVNQLSVSSGSVAYYTPENAQGQISELTFGEAPFLTRHNLMGLVPVSNILLDDAAEAERIVREDMAEVMALREDLAFLRGTGLSGEPTGLRNKGGVTLDPIAPGANGFQPSLYDLRRIRARFRALNARNPRPVWFFNTAFISYLETLSDTLGRPLLESSLLTINEDQSTGVIDGTPFFATNQIPANLTQGSASNATDLMLVDISTVVVGTADELELDVSTEATYWDGTQWVSTYQNRQSLFRGWLSHDIAAQRPNMIIVQRGVLV